MSFNEWLKSKRTVFELMFPTTSWSALTKFLTEVYQVGYDKGYEDGKEVAKWTIQL